MGCQVEDCYEREEGRRHSAATRTEIESKVEWDNGREGVNLDMQTRTLSTPYQMFDFSGYRNNGAFSQTGTVWCNGANTEGPCLKPGKQGKSLDFDGSSTSLTIPATPYSTSNGSFSVALWLSPDNFWLSSHQCMINVISFSNPTLGYVPWYLEILPTQVSDSYANLLAHVGWDTGTETRLWANDSIAISADDGFNPLTWTHVALTWDGRDIVLFINGAPVNWSGGQGKLRAPYSASPDIYVGKGWNTCGTGGITYFQGAIDELKIYTRGLTDEQVREMYLLEGGAFNRSTTAARKTFIQYNSLGLTTETKTEATVDQISQGTSAWPWLITRWGYQGASGYFNPKNVTSPLGQVTNFTYSSSYPAGAYLTQVQTSIGGTTYTYNYSYTDLGKVKQEKSPMGYMTNYTYDAIGRVLTVTHPEYDGTNPAYVGTFPQEVFTYNDISRVVNWTAPSGWRLREQYDGLGRVSLETRLAPSATGFARDRKIQFLYNHLDQVWDVIGPETIGGANQDWVTMYDSLGRVIETQSPSGRTVRTYTVYDDVNRLVTFKDAENKWTVYAQDFSGRVVGTCQWPTRPAPGADQSDPNLMCFPSTALTTIKTSMAYDLAGHPYIQTDGEGNARKWNYDQLGQVTKEWYSGANQRTFAQVYDLVNRTRSDKYFDGYGAPTILKYDGLGRLNLTTYPDGSTVWVGYDLENRLGGTGNANAINTYLYNSWDQIVNKTTLFVLAGVSKSVTMQYDWYGRLANHTNPAPNNVVVNYTYDILLPGDNFDRLRSVTGNWQGGVDPIDYNKMDEVVGMRMNPTSGWNVNYSYDTSWRLNEILVGLNAQGTQIRKWNYTYLKNGNVAQEKNYTGTSLTTETYVYDDISRLLSYTRGSSTTSYSYDKDGNRLNKTNATGVTTSYSYLTNGGLNGDLLTHLQTPAVNPTNQTNFTFGRNGEMVNKTDNGGHTKTNGADWNYTYDGAGRLKSVKYWKNGGSQVTLGDYTYGPDGELLRRIEGGSTSEYYFALGGAVFFSWIAGGSTTDYVYGGGQLVAVRSGVGAPSYVFADGNGNTRLLVLPSQAVVWEAYYSPFGEITMVSNTTAFDFHFAGNNEREAVKLSYFHARWYDSSLGRFMTRDPVEQGALTTQTLNLYTYALNNPKTLSDPSGLFPVIIAIIVAAWIIVTAVVIAFWAYSTYDWYTNRATEAERGGFWIGIGAAIAVAVIVVVACVFTACIAAGPLLMILGADAALVGYYYGTQALGGEPTFEGMAVAFGAGSVVAPFAYRAAVRFGPIAEPQGIGATGKVGENYLARLGGESQVYYSTSTGPRFVDQLIQGWAHESKVGYQALTKSISRQIAKDVELMAKNKVVGVTWHFFQSPVTGKIGPSGPLLQAVRNAKIGIVIH